MTMRKFNKAGYVLLINNKFPHESGEPTESAGKVGPRGWVSGHVYVYPSRKDAIEEREFMFRNGWKATKFRVAKVRVVEA